VSSPSLEDLALHAVHALEPREVEDMERALTENPALRAEFTAMETALAKLGASVKQREPTASLEARVLSAVKAASPPVLRRAPIRGTSAAAPSRSSWTRPAFATVSLMGLGLIAFLGIQSSGLQAEITALKSQTRQQTAILSTASNIKLASTSAGATPIGQAYLTKSGQIVIALNLPAPENGKTYQAWFIPKGETAPRPLQTFTTGLTTEVPANAAAIAVSLEPAGGSQTPTTVLGVGAVKL
jgi:anti-sigma-K factor RskA